MHAMGTNVIWRHRGWPRAGKEAILSGFLSLQEFTPKGELYERVSNHALHFQNKP